MQNISHHSPSPQTIVTATVERIRNVLTVHGVLFFFGGGASPSENYLVTQQLRLQFSGSLDSKKKLNQKDNRKTHARK